MTSSKQNLLISLLWALFFVYFSRVVLQSEIIFHIDHAIYSFFSEHMDASYIGLLKFITFFGGAGFIMTTAGFVFIYLCYKGWLREAIIYFLIISFALLMNTALKTLYLRDRPEILWPGMDLTTYSYPSGHTSGSVVFYLFTFYVLKERGLKWITSNWVFPLSMIIIFCIGASRVLLGVHWISDVVGGIIWSMGWLFLAVGFYKYFKFFQHEA